MTGSSAGRLADLRQQLETAAARHADVGDQHVGLASRRNAASAVSASSKAVGDMPPCRSARSSTQRIEASSSTSQTLSRLRVSWTWKGSRIVKTVRPGRLSNSISPSWRLTRSCATARPSPVPPRGRSRADRTSSRADARERPARCPRPGRWRRRDSGALPMLTLVSARAQHDAPLPPFCRRPAARCARD